MGDIDSRTLLEGNAIFTEFKGALTEQYVFQQLDGLNDYVIYYWSAERSTAEVDSLIQYNDRFIPVEVKAEENLQSKKLKSFQGEIQSGIFFTPIYVRFPEARPAYESAALCNHFDGKSLTTKREYNLPELNKILESGTQLHRHFDPSHHSFMIL